MVPPVARRTDVQQRFSRVPTNLQSVLVNVSTDAGMWQRLRIAFLIKVDAIDRFLPFPARASSSKIMALAIGPFAGWGTRRLLAVTRCTPLLHTGSLDPATH